MFNKKSWNKIKAFSGILMCAMAILAAPSTSLISYAAETSGVTEIEPRTEVREWMWKVEDGKLYKRLYNASTGLWETDWIYVCDYDGEL